MHQNFQPRTFIFFTIVIYIVSLTPVYAQAYPPKLTLTSDLSTLKKDEGTRIRWRAARATSCQAIGGWTNRTAPFDKHWISSIEQTTTYQMTCIGEGGSITQSITIARATDDSTRATDDSKRDDDNSREIDDKDEESRQSAPKLTLTSDLSTLKKDEGTRIRWSASNADSCRAIGGWTSKTGAIDKHWISSIEQTTSYQLTCVGEGGSATQSITLTRATNDTEEEPVQEEPQQPAPTLSLTSDLTSVDSDSSTTIRWTSNNTNSCNAENNWTAKTDITGKQFIGSIQSTTLYTMTCTGEGGTVSKSVLVTVDSPTITTGSVDLNWTSPTSNQDGTELSDLAGYKIYFGPSQNNLNNVVDIDTGLTNYVIENLPSGTHYFAITAIDFNGNESNRSNIAAKVVD